MTTRSIADSVFEAARSSWPIAALTAASMLLYLFGILWTTGVDGRIVQGDARSYFAYLPSLLLDQDIDLGNQFEDEYFAGRDDARYPFGEGVDGRAVNVMPIGPSLVWSPGFLVGAAIDAVTRGLGTGQRPGYGPGSALGASLMSILAAGLGAWFSYRFLRQLASSRIALGATLLVWIGTPALYYTVISPLYSHTAAWAAAAALLAFLPRDGSYAPTSRRALSLGVVAGFLVCIRLQDAPLLVLPLGCLWLNDQDATARLKWIGWFTLGAACGYLPQGFTWYRIFGTLVPVAPEVTVGTDLAGSPLARAGEVLFSTGYEGWLSWSPLSLMGLVGLMVMAAGTRPDRRRLASLGLLALAGMVFLDAIHPYDAGVSFGGRRYLSFTPLLAAGLAEIFQRARSGITSMRIPIAGWVAVALAGWNLILLVSYEMLVLRHDTYAPLHRVVRYALLGQPGP